MKNEKLFKKKVCIFFLLIGVLFFINFASSISNQTSLVVTKDTYVRQDSANNNYGTENLMEFREGTSNARDIYLEFNLNFPNQTQFHNAVICSYQISDGDTYVAELYHLWGGWRSGVDGSTLTETQITWDNQPCGTTHNNATNCNLTMLSLNYTTLNNDWLCWNVPISVLNDYKNSSLGFMLKSPRLISLGVDTFRSKEGNINEATYLWINYSDCIPDWIANYTPCNASDNMTKYYYDTNLCGTYDELPVDNGTIEYCDYCTPDWYCSVFDTTCEDGSNPTWLNCLNVSDSNSPTCCSLTDLNSDCISPNESIYAKPCGNITYYLNVPTYPYVALNTTYPIKYTIFLDGVAEYVGDVKIDINNTEGNTSTFNLTWNSATKSYDINLIFTETGNYPFKIHTEYPYFIDFISTFLVRETFNVTFCGFMQKDLKVYKNEFAYLIAEFTTSKQHYDDTLEQFITPLGFKTIYKTPVFHTLYRDGCGTFTLYGKGEYAVRLFDGVATFDKTFSPPNITKTYGTNIYLGKYILDGEIEKYNILLTEKDTNQYRWLFNWVYIILLFVALIGAIFLFFVIPQMPLLSLIFGLGFVSMLTLIRIVLWIWKGW